MSHLDLMILNCAWKTTEPGSFGNFTGKHLARNFKLKIKMSTEKPVYDKKLYEDFFKREILAHKRRVDDIIEKTRLVICISVILAIIFFVLGMFILGVISCGIALFYLVHCQYLETHYDVPYKPGFKKRVLAGDEFIHEWTRAWKQYLLEKNLLDLDV